MKNKNRHSILFLSNSVVNLHLIAECLARKGHTENVRFASASLFSKSLCPIVKRVMLASGEDVSKMPLLSLREIELFMFDLIVTIGSPRQMEDISLPVMLPHFHWETPDTDTIEDNEEKFRSVIEAKQIIADSIKNLFDSEFLHALFSVRHHLQLILDNMLDGVMAHTRKRIIFFFNKTAEAITACKRENVLGRDCHDVFPGRFCGGDCDFCDGSSLGGKKDKIKKKVGYEGLDGKSKTLEMLSLPLSDESKNNVGALLIFKDETDLETAKSHLKHHHCLGGMITKDPKMLAIFDQIKEVASIQAPVLIEGESGTGKELVANAIHDASPRAGKPFVAVNCGALPEGILESELFGHVKGAFTGAIADKKGRFELAHQGTLFLDEVGELSPTMQVKLLRVLQEQSFERVGGEKLIHVNTRIISATNQRLKALMKVKKFRRDLYYRLCVVPITLPPLRERRLDIPTLVEHFLEVVAAETDRPVLGYANEATDVLSGYSWPGNVRELRNAIEFAYVKCRDSIIGIEHLPPEIVAYQRKVVRKTGPPLKIGKERVIMALSETNGNRKEAAKMLGVGRATLYRYLDQYSLR